MVVMVFMMMMVVMVCCGGKISGDVKNGDDDLDNDIE